jgi:hypothetical protein
MSSLVNFMGGTMAKYPEPKKRDLTAAEKSVIHQHLDAGDDNIYSLAIRFGCSASQIAGLKAHRSR